MPGSKSTEKSSQSSQSVKININLGEKKKPKKARGKRKPRQKKLTESSVLASSTTGMTRAQMPYQTQLQPQYIPMYVNQYPNFVGSGLSNYMNSGIPTNPQILSQTLPLLTSGSSTSPTSTMTKMISNNKFNIPESFYVPTQKPNYPRIDIKKKVEDIQLPKQKLPKQNLIEFEPISDFEQRRENLITFFDDETGLPIKTRERGEREKEDYMLEGGDEMEFFDVEIENENKRKPITGQRLQPSSTATWNEEDDDEGFFDVM
jgi:hypothetical protein